MIKEKRSKQNKVVYKVTDINRDTKDQNKSKTKSSQHLEDTLLLSWEVRTLFLEKIHILFLHEYTITTILKTIKVQLKRKNSTAKKKKKGERPREKSLPL